MDKYTLRYLPLFYEDFSEIINYISVKLKNPSAGLPQYKSETESKKLFSCHIIRQNCHILFQTCHTIRAHLIKKCLRHFSSPAPQS